MKGAAIVAAKAVAVKAAVATMMAVAHLDRPHRPKLLLGTSRKRIAKAKVAMV